MSSESKERTIAALLDTIDDLRDKVAGLEAVVKGVHDTGQWAPSE
jgi:hypothetical protein